MYSIQNHGNMYIYMLHKTSRKAYIPLARIWLHWKFPQDLLKPFPNYLMGWSPSKTYFTFGFLLVSYKPYPQQTRLNWSLSAILARLVYCSGCSDTNVSESNFPLLQCNKWKSGKITVAGLTHCVAYFAQSYVACYSVIRMWRIEQRKMVDTPVTLFFFFFLSSAQSMLLQHGLYSHSSSLCCHHHHHQLN